MNRIIIYYVFAREITRPIPQLKATEGEVVEFGRLVQGTKISVGDRFRARIILLRVYGSGTMPNSRLRFK
jgi:hypothetical protein